MELSNLLSYKDMLQKELQHNCSNDAARKNTLRFLQSINKEIVAKLGYNVDRSDNERNT